MRPHGAARSAGLTDIEVVDRSVLNAVLAGITLVPRSMEYSRSLWSGAIHARVPCRLQLVVFLSSRRPRLESGPEEGPGFGAGVRRSARVHFAQQNASVRTLRALWFAVSLRGRGPLRSPLTQTHGRVFARWAYALDNG